MSIIDTYKLTKTYKNGNGIENVSIEVKEGAFFGLLGTEQSGKTTFTRILMNMLRPTSGSAVVFDADTRRDIGSIRKNIGFVPSVFNPCFDMKLAKFMRYCLALHGMRDDGGIMDLCEAFSLDPKCRISAMPEDEKKRALIASQLLHHPKLLILDEPSLSLDAYERSGVFACLKDLNAQGTTIFFTTRSAEEVRRFCTHTAVINEGSILGCGEVKNFRAFSTLKVTVSVEEDAYDMARTLQVRNFSSSGSVISFIYEGSVDELIKKMSAFTVKTFSISEATIDTVLFSLQERGVGNGI